MNSVFGYEMRSHASCSEMQTTILWIFELSIPSPLNFGYTVYDIDGTAAVTTEHGSVMNFFAKFIHDREEARKKFGNREIFQEEHSPRGARKSRSVLGIMTHG